MRKQKWIWVSFIIGLYLLLMVPFIQSIIKTLLYIALPFFIAYILTYIISPIKKFLVQHKWQETIAILSIILCITSIISFIIFIAIRSFYIELQLLRSSFNEYNFTYTLMNNPYVKQFNALPISIQDWLQKYFVNWISQIELYGPAMLQYIQTSVELFIFCTIIPFLMFYMMKDGRRFKHKLITFGNKLLPFRMETTLKNIEGSVGYYIKGQLYITVILIFVLYIIYKILSIKFAFMLAFIMGVFNLIPFIGPIIGTVIVAIVASFASIKLVIVVIIVHIIIQLLENSILTPYILGKTVQLHPVAVLVWLMIGAHIAGLIGMLWIIPLVLIGKVIIEQKQDQKSFNIYSK